MTDSCPSWSIKLPTFIPYGVKKVRNFHLNLNVYRNAPFHQLAEMKKRFTEQVAPLVNHLPKDMESIRISYWLVTGTRRTPDVANVCCIVDKFFSDVLTKEGIIPDDNPLFLSMVAFGYGGYEKGNPHVEAVIERLK